MTVLVGRTARRLSGPGAGGPRAEGVDGPGGGRTPAAGTGGRWPPALLVRASGPVRPVARPAARPPARPGARSGGGERNRARPPRRSPPPRRATAAGPWPARQARDPRDRRAARVTGVGVEHRQVVPGQVDPALVPVEEPDPPVVTDPEVPGADVTVHHPDRRLGNGGEQLHHQLGHVGRQAVEIGIDAAPVPMQLVDPAAPGPLPVTGGQRMQPNQLGPDPAPVVDAARLPPVEPSLHHHAVDRRSAVVGGQHGRHHEAPTLEQPEEVELPGQRRARPSTAADRHRVAPKPAAPDRAPGPAIGPAEHFETGPGRDLRQLVRSGHGGRHALDASRPPDRQARRRHRATPGPPTVDRVGAMEPAGDRSSNRVGIAFVAVQFLLLVTLIALPGSDHWPVPIVVEIVAWR